MVEKAKGRAERKERKRVVKEKMKKGGRGLSKGEI